MKLPLPMPFKTATLISTPNPIHLLPYLFFTCTYGPLPYIYFNPAFCFLYLTWTPSKAWIHWCVDQLRQVPSPGKVSLMFLELVIYNYKIKFHHTYWSPFMIYCIINPIYLSKYMNVRTIIQGLRYLNSIKPNKLRGVNP